MAEKQALYRRNLQSMRAIIDAKAEDDRINKIVDSIYISVVNTATVGQRRFYIHSIRDMLVKEVNKLLPLLKPLFPYCIVRYVDYEREFNGNAFEEIEKSIVVDWS